MNKRIFIGSIFLAVALPLSVAQQHGTTAESRNVAALQRGLDWLVKSQDESGAWKGDIGYKFNNSFKVQRADVPHVGVTALAVLSLTANGRGPADGKDGEAAVAGLRFLASRVSKDGYLSSHGSRMMSHLLAIRALARAQRLAPRKTWLDALMPAVAFTLARQNDEGGWRYQPHVDCLLMQVVVPVSQTRAMPSTT